MSNEELFSFEKLIVYQRSVAFSCSVYENTKAWPKEYAFSLTDQLRRAALSICLNIAEGSARTKDDFKRFITISRSSCHECVAIIEITWKQGIIDNARKEEWRKELISISKMLSKLKSSI